MIETLMSRAREYLPAERLGVVEDAYRYAEDAHRGQSRKSGEPFIEHPLQTAVALADLKMDANGLAAALPARRGRGPRRHRVGRHPGALR